MALVGQESHSAEQISSEQVIDPGDCIQMPRGVPVATVAIGNAANAGLLAARILATSKAQLLERMLAYQVTKSAPWNLILLTCQIGRFWNRVQPHCSSPQHHDETRAIAGEHAENRLVQG